MNKFIKNIAFAFVVALLVAPALATASGDYYEYGSYDTYDYGSYSSYGSYDTYDYISYYDYGSYDTYDYDDYYSYGSYDTYDYDSYYDYGSYDTYDYDEYSSYGSYDTYDYDSYSSYGSYDTYDYDDYSSYGSYDTYDYEDISYANVGSYDGYDDYDYYGDYDDYGYYDGGSYYGGGSNCGSNCGGGNYNPPCRTNCNPPYNPPQTKDLKVVCVPSKSRIEVGDSVTFEAEVTGGTAPYTYRWTGDITSSSRTVTVRFDDEGNYRVVVKVTDKKGRTATDDCEVEVEEDEHEDFDAICVPAKTTVDKGDRVTFEARVEGGDRPYEYDWSGDANGDDDEVTVRFSRTGTYEIDLKVTDDEGRVARDTCVVRVRDEDDDDDRDINVVTDIPDNDTFSSVGSVYLNQVPYTGPEDVAKGAAFVGILLAWSIAGAMVLRSKKNKTEVSDRIAAFKEANKMAKA